MFNLYIKMYIYYLNIIMFIWLCLYWCWIQPYHRHLLLLLISFKWPARPAPATGALAWLIWGSLLSLAAGATVRTTVLQHPGWASCPFPPAFGVPRWSPDVRANLLRASGVYVGASPWARRRIGAERLKKIVGTDSTRTRVRIESGRNGTVVNFFWK